MLVSILISNHNYGAYLGAAVDSALAQDYPCCEVVVVDDGSVDNSAEIINRYGERIRAYFKPQGGQMSAVNLGFKHASGDIVILLDSDDVLLPSAASQHVAALSEPGAVRSHGYLVTTDPELTPTGGRVPTFLSPSGDYRARQAADGPLVNQPSFTSGLAWTRAFLEAVLPLPEDGPPGLGPDGYLTSVDSFYGRIVALDEPVGYYRVHESNGGPKNYQFSPAYLKKRLLWSDYRLAFSAQHAKKLGVPVDMARWHALRGWKMTLAIYALNRMGEQPDGPTRAALIRSPLHSLRPIGVKRLALSALLAVLSVLPRAPALRLAALLLDNTWGRDRQRAGFAIRDHQPTPTETLH